MALGEAMKKQGKDRCKLPHVLHARCSCSLCDPLDLELRLSGIPAARRKSIAQKRQPCASILIRLRPPPSAVQDNDDLGDGVSLLSSGEI